MEAQDWKCLARLRLSSDGQHLLKLLRAELEDNRNRLELVPDQDQFRQLQGVCKTLRSLIEQIESAPEVVNKHYS